jgi:hypothetical protein
VNPYPSIPLSSLYHPSISVPRLEAQKASNPASQRLVGFPWEGDIGLFFHGSADLARQVAKFFSPIPSFFRDPPQVFENVEYS